MSAALQLYRGATRALSPFAPLWLRARASAGKEDAARLPERFGRSEAQRPAGTLVWLHGASVGEMAVLLLLREALAARDPALSFLITTGTRTSAELYAKRAPARTQHAYAPLDLPDAVARFLDHWRPDVGVFAESELWPNLICAARARTIPLALANACMSASAIAQWRRTPDAAKELLSAFPVLLAADERTHEALSSLSGRTLPAPANLKLAAPPPRVDVDALAALKAEVGARPLWLGASTHPGEDEILLAAHEKLRAERPDALLIIVPRHTERGAKIASMAGDAPRRSSGALIGDAAVYIADTMGELGTLYALAQVSFVGGSLLPHMEGHNAAEPAALGSAILSGPYVAKNTPLFDALSEAAALRTVRDGSEIAAVVSLLWRDGAQRDRLIANARAALAAGGAALFTTTDALMALLPQRAHAPA